MRFCGHCSTAVLWFQRADLRSGLRCSLTRAFIFLLRVFMRASLASFFLAFQGTTQVILAVLEWVWPCSNGWAFPPAGLHVSRHLISKCLHAPASNVRARPEWLIWYKSASFTNPLVIVVCLVPFSVSLIRITHASLSSSASNFKQPWCLQWPPFWLMVDPLFVLQTVFALVLISTAQMKALGTSLGDTLSPGSLNACPDVLCIFQASLNFKLGSQSLTSIFFFLVKEVVFSSLLHFLIPPHFEEKPKETHYNNFLICALEILFESGDSKGIGFFLHSQNTNTSSMLP